jgi:uncharacterized lipoprotein YddW (UPF0748 family)
MPTNGNEASRPNALAVIGDGGPGAPYDTVELVRNWAQDGVEVVTNSETTPADGLVVWWSPALTEADLAALQATLKRQPILLTLLMSANQYQRAASSSLLRWLDTAGWGDVSGRGAAEAGRMSDEDDHDEEGALKRFDSLGALVGIKALRVLVVLDEPTTPPAIQPSTAAAPSVLLPTDLTAAPPVAGSTGTTDTPLPPQVDLEVTSEVRSATFAKRLLQWMEQARQVFQKQKLAREAVVRNYVKDLDAAKSLFAEDMEVTKRLAQALSALPTSPYPPASASSTKLSSSGGRPLTQSSNAGTSLSINPSSLADRLAMANSLLAKADAFAAQLVAQGPDVSVPEPTLTDYYRQAKQLYQQAWSLVIPPLPPAHARSLWLDRGTLVKAGSPEGFRQLLAQYKALGIKDLFIETINAGFPIVDSEVQPLKNPLIRGWDPLAIALEYAHHNGQRVHAWVWCFAVGNRRHNPLIGQSDDYVGPILNQADLMTEGLAFSPSPAGVLNRQEEFWMSPASSAGQQYLLKLFKDIVARYEVDGIHLDYIRWPFQKSNWLAGVDQGSLRQYYADTTPPQPEAPGPSPMIAFLQQAAEAAAAAAKEAQIRAAEEAERSKALPGDFTNPIVLPLPPPSKPLPSPTILPFNAPASWAEPKEGGAPIPGEASPTVEVAPAKPSSTHGRSAKPSLNPSSAATLVSPPEAVSRALWVQSKTGKASSTVKGRVPLASGSKKKVIPVAKRPTTGKLVVASTIKPGPKPVVVPPKPAGPKPLELSYAQKIQLRAWEQKKAIWSAYQLRLKRQEDAIARGTIPESRAQWQTWKAEQVSQFVRQVSTQLKAQRPGLIVSGAVFALPRANRMAMIQQDWERWLREGWMDWLIPMTYTDQVAELRQQANYLYAQAEASGSLVMPGLGLHKLDGPTTVLAMRTLQQTGVAGHTLFAASQVTDDKRGWLTQGPYQLASAVPGAAAISPQLGRQWVQQQTAVLKALLGPTIGAGLAPVPTASTAWYGSQWKPVYEQTRREIWETYGYQPQWANYLTGELMRLNLLVRYVQRHEGGTGGGS